MQPTRAALAGVLFAYFALLGALTPYLSLYLVAQGFSAQMAGLLMALPQLIRILAPPVWGWLADHARRPARLLCASAAVALVMLVLLPICGQRPWAVATVLAVMHLALAGQSPITEALTVSAAAGDAARYGRMRLWGSVGFIVAVSLVGWLLERYGTDSLVGWLAVGALGLVAATWRLGWACEGRGKAAHKASKKTSNGAARHKGLTLRAALQAWVSSAAPAPGWRVVALFLASAALMVFAHAALYAYFSLYLQLHGWGKQEIGAFWALGVAVEIGVFAQQRPLFERFSALSLLATSLWVAVVRFALLAASPAGLVVVVLTQMTHAVTFGVHHSACMSLMHRWFAPHVQARAQALFTSVVYGVGGFLGGVACSAVWVRVSPAATFALASGAALAGWMVLAVCMRVLRRASPAGG
jgi:PPP family 3-phenylpropionic acid transporter